MKIKQQTTRDKLQEKFALKWLETKFGILYLTPRFGKIYTTINILERMEEDIKILIAYPDVKIKKSWQKDFVTREYDDSNVTYTTHVSLKKHIGKKFGIVIVDEIHLLSEAQRFALGDIMENNLNVLGLTGTLMVRSESQIYRELKLPVVAQYTLDEGVRDGIIPDYSIKVVTVPLDNVQKGHHKKKDKTDKKQYSGLTWVINKFDRERRNANFLRMNRMRLLQNSISKREKALRILKKYEKERILVFCGTIAAADSLGIPSYHNKVKDKQVFQDFVDGKTNHLAVVKIGNSGVTYKSLNKILVTSFDSNAENLAQKINRAMSLETDDPHKEAKIVILTSPEEVELNWLRKALEFFDPEKITYL